MLLSFIQDTMSLGRVLLLSTAAIGGTLIAMKPEARKNVKKMVALQLHKIGNALDPQGPPPMWSDKEGEEVPHPVATGEELADPAKEDLASNDAEDRTIHGFKVKK